MMKPTTRLLNALAITTLLLGACSQTTNNQQSTAQSGNTTKQNTKNNTHSKPLDAPRNKPATRPRAASNRVEGVVQKHGAFWVIVHGNKHLCLPPGLFRQVGLKLLFDKTTIQPPPPNARLACLRFDQSTIALKTPPKGMNTLTLSVVKQASGMVLQYQRRVALGPAAMGSRTHTVCWPEGLQVKPGATVRLTGYPRPAKPATSCEPWVFVKRVP